MQYRNNLVVVLALALLGFLCAFRLEWFAIPSGPMDPNGPMMVDGITSTLSLFMLHDVPVWFLLVFSIAATAIAFTNLARLTTIPVFLLFLMLGAPGLFFLKPFFTFADDVKISQGPMVALLATFAAMAIVVLTPVPDYVTDRAIARMERRMKRLSKRIVE